MKSFSAQVKQEIISNLNNKMKYRACLAGMLLCCKSIQESEIIFATENPEIANFFITQVENVIGNQTVNQYVSEKKRALLYTLSVENSVQIKQLFDYCGFNDVHRKITKELCISLKDKNLCCFVGGIFISCGSVIDPNKEYHLEFVFPTLDLCNEFGLMMIEKFGILCKHTTRKNNEIVYLKESEAIEDIVTLMGATMGTLEIMNVKILKDVRNKVNRTINCDNANIDKSLRAAERQIEDIETIINSNAFNELSDELRTMAQLRMENPDYNLKELGQALQISRSGANHRLQRLSQIAEKIRKKGGEGK